MAEAAANSTVRWNRSIPVRTNFVLVTGVVAVNIWLYLLLPLIFLPLGPWWALTLIPVALTTTTTWALIHETIHGSLYPDGRINVTIGRGLGILFGAPYRLLRFGHLAHHRLNRSELDRTEVYERGKRSWFGAAARFYFRLLIGLYLSELASNLLVWLPAPVLSRLAARSLRGADPTRRRELAMLRAQLLGTVGLHELRIDAALVIALMTLSVFCYGAHWYLLVLALAARGVLVSILDNSFHYGTPLNEVAYSYNLSFGRLGPAILNFNLHRVHHHNPAAPWIALPMLRLAEGEPCEASLIAACLRQLRGPIATDELTTVPN